MGLGHVVSPGPTLTDFLYRFKLLGNIPLVHGGVLYGRNDTRGYSKDHEIQYRDVRDQVTKETICGLISVRQISSTFSSITAS